MEASRAERERGQQQQHEAERDDQQRTGAQRETEQREEEQRDQQAEQEAPRDQQAEQEAPRDQQAEQEDQRDEEQDEAEEQEEAEGQDEAEEDSGPYLSLKRLNWGEGLGMLAALALVGTMFLPWFSTDATNKHSIIRSAKIGPGETATAWQTFPILKWILLAICVAPFVLTWIVARGHKLSWLPGEITMILGMGAVVLILCNGIVLGTPKSTTTASIQVSLQYGYLLALLAALALGFAGYWRQALHQDTSQPPGVM